MKPIFVDEILRELTTIHDFLRWTVSCFNSADIYYGHGTDNPWTEAWCLIMTTVYLSYEDKDRVLYAKLTTSEKSKIIDKVLQRTQEKIPLPYLTHIAYFAGYDFYVDERVIIPRSPIAELIDDRFVSIIGERQIDHILDLCTGSGCIAIACSYAFPNAMIDAIDIDLDAINVAEINIERHDKSEHVFPIQSDLFLEVQHQKYDLIISNPPYVDAQDFANMPEEYQREPTLALCSGEDGLDITRKILSQAYHHLNDEGVLILEVGNSWVHLVDVFPSVKFNWISFKNGGEGVFYLTKKELFPFITA